jgi:hypothetical protein
MVRNHPTIDVVFDLRLVTPAGRDPETPNLKLRKYRQMRAVHIETAVGLRAAMVCVLGYSRPAAGVRRQNAPVPCTFHRATRLAGI